MTRTVNEFVLNLAPTGAVARRDHRPHVPLTRDEIVRDVLDCVPLGVTIAHLHARDAEGRPSGDPETYARMISSLREQAPELVICVSCSGRTMPERESRLRVLDLSGDVRPDMASLTLGSLNFPTEASVNDLETIVRLAERMRERGIKPELEIFDLGMMNVARHLIEKGILEAPHYVNFILGNVASAQFDLLHVAALLSGLPQDSVWALGGIGRAQLPANALALVCGDGVRVGLEDNLCMDGNGTLATNRSLVERVLAIARPLGRSPMPPGHLRARLRLPLKE